MPLGWDAIKNQQLEDESRDAWNGLLFSKSHTLAQVATVHKATPPLQHYLHSIFRIVDHTTDLVHSAQRQLSSFLPVEYAAGYVLPFRCNVSYPHSPIAGIKTRALETMCADMIVNSVDFAFERTKPLVEMDAMWFLYEDTNVPMPLSPINTNRLSAMQRRVVLTAIDSSMSTSEASLVTRFLASLDATGADADVAVFVHAKLAATVRDAVKAHHAATASVTPGPASSTNKHRQVYVFPFNNAPSAPLETRYLLWQSFMARFQLLYSDTLVVHDIRAVFQLDPFRAIDTRGGFAVFGDEILPESVSLNKEFMNSTFGHCWVDAFSISKYDMVEDPASPGSPATMWESEVPPGWRRVAHQKYFWSPTVLMPGVAIGATRALLRFLAQTIDTLYKSTSPGPCNLAQMVHRTVFNFDIAVAYRQSLFAGDTSPVRSVTMEELNRHAQARISSSLDKQSKSKPKLMRAASGFVPALLLPQTDLLAD
jgi:hypothetical protein